MLLILNGGHSRDRTYDPLIKSQLLYQLSYVPVSRLAATSEGSITGQILPVQPFLKTL